MNSKRECLAISTPFVNILNYKLNKNYELNENYRLTIKNIYIKLFLKCPIPIITSGCLGSPQCTQPRTDCASDKKSNPVRTASWLCFYDSVSGFR